jgi:hypothetical protein
MNPDENPVHYCHGCQTCLAELIDPADIPNPPVCDDYPRCIATCTWPTCTAASTHPRTANL